MEYGAKLVTAPEGGFVVTFRDIPEAITQGDTVEEALEMAADALLSAIDFYFEDKRPVPAPSALRKGEVAVSLSPSVTAKILLLNEMVAQKVSAAELSRRMGMKRPTDAQRLADLHHASKIDTIATAMSTMGKRLEICIS